MRTGEVIAIIVVFCIVAVAAAYIGLNAGIGGANNDRPTGQLSTISGMVTDAHKNGMPGAKVTLWETRLDGATGQYINVKAAAVENNPQDSNADPVIAAVGTYTFFNVSTGTYNVTAEKTDSAGNNHMWFVIVHATSGVATGNIVMMDLIDGRYVPVPTAMPTDNPDPVNGGNSSEPVRPYCIISGFITDKNKNGIPGANVTLMEARIDNATDTFVNVRPATVDGNPQVSDIDPTIAAVGTYTFYKVPYGFYNITAEKDGHVWFAVVNATYAGTQTVNVAIPDYVYSVPTPPYPKT